MATDKGRGGTNRSCSVEVGQEVRGTKSSKEAKCTQANCLTLRTLSLRQISIGMQVFPFKITTNCPGVVNSFPRLTLGALHPERADESC